MKTKDARIERFHLDAPIHMTGLSLAGSDLPPAFESQLGIAGPARRGCVQAPKGCRLENLPFRRNG